MDLTSQPVAQDLVLIGGGHTHAIALRMFGMQPLPGVRLTLITEASDTAYSGMLPGHVAGFYSREECHIDLRPLAQFAQAQLYLDQAIGLDLENQRVLCANRPPVAFDLLSIDIGSTPKLPEILAADSQIIPAKPVRGFLAAWDQLLEDIHRNPQQPLSIGIVGGGTGGVELALNVQHHLQQILQAAQQPPENLSIHLFQRTAELLPDHHLRVRRLFHQLLIQRGIQLHFQEDVRQVERQQIRCASGLTIHCDAILWVTEATAPDWLVKAGLAVDEHGFILVNDYLQSLSHPQVFAAGDIATMVNHPRPKAGVFAVRQGKPLFRNLQRSLLGQSLRRFIPQRQYLKLVGTGDESAIASRGMLSWQSPLLWNWKDWIDRRFMQRFSNLPDMSKKPERATRNSGEKLAELTLLSSATSVSANHANMRCAGCGSKVGSPVLERVLHRIRQDTPDWTEPADIVLGLDAPDDAAVIEVSAGNAMIQTVDYFRSLINDPFLFGQICTNHCLSDIFAMGAKPHSALAIATIPYALEAKVEETLYQLLSGALKGLHQAGASLIGGHTTEGAELSFGLTCNGLAARDRLLRKSGMQPGQALILTKALGTGTLFAADMQRQAKGRWIDGAVASMLQSNQAAADCLRQHQATACTDVTGFGLLGHLLEMVRASQVAVELKLESIPLLEGASETVQQGILSSLHLQNLQIQHQIDSLSLIHDHPDFPLLFDPQTAGGLLATVPPDRALDCLTCLKTAGYTASRLIGWVMPITEASLPIKIKL